MSRMIAAVCLCARPRVRRFFLVAIALALVCVASPASAVVLSYTTFMDGPSEDPPNGSLGTGTARVDYDNVAHSMRVRADFSGLTGTTTMAHIHAPTTTPFVSTAGVATQTPSFTGFPIGVTAGSMDTTFDLTLASSWNAPFITNNGGTTATAEAAFASFLASGRAYYNVHTSFRGGGEIRGFLVLVPEPATAGLVGISILAMLASVRRRNRG